MHYRGAAALPSGFDVLRQLGGAAAVAAHTHSLANELARRLGELQHGSGQRAITLYGARAMATAAGNDADADISPAERADGTGGLCSGPTVAFNVRRSDGEFVGYAEVAKLAALYDPPIQLRVGCCCNPGGCQRALGMSNEMILAAAASGK
eukprot:5193888-Prymnesium_polylepis.1